MCALLFLLGCGDPAPPSREGVVAVPNATLWYRVVGTGDAIPLLVIHGGPGGRSCELATLEALANERPVIFYDQRGSGRSSLATDTASWNLPRFVADLDSLRRALGLSQLHLYGHSWGAAVAVIPGAAHVAMQDAPGPYVKRLRRFLQTTGGGR